MNNKILKPWLMLGILLWLPDFLAAQKIPRNAHGLPVITSSTLFQKSLAGHPGKQMINLARIPHIRFDLRYASENNFMHHTLYPAGTNTTYLRAPAWRALDSVSRVLYDSGLVLIIFDAYRPYSVTEMLWTQVRDARYAANPAMGSGHNRGIAVDLTLASARTGEMLPMPTGFDNFSDSAHQDFMFLEPDRIRNRKTLTDVMTKYGFIPLPTEWWHFSWPDPAAYDLLDLQFEELDKLNP